MGVAESALVLGCDVVLDFGLWSRRECLDFRDRARRLGVGFRVHYVDVATVDLYRRLRARNRESNPPAFTILESMMEEYVRIFERPLPDELVGFDPGT